MKKIMILVFSLLTGVCFGQSGFNATLDSVQVAAYPSGKRVVYIPKMLTITQGSGIAISGTYPNLTIAATATGGISGTTSNGFLIGGTGANTVGNTGITYNSTGISVGGGTPTASFQALAQSPNTLYQFTGGGTTAYAGYFVRDSSGIPTARVQYALRDPDPTLNNQLHIQAYKPGMYIRFTPAVGYANSSVIDTLGRVGVITTTPTAALDVNGTLRIRGNGAAAGNILTSDANGNATWQKLFGTNPLPEYADNAAAIAAGLQVNAPYRTGDFLKVVH